MVTIQLNNFRVRQARLNSDTILKVPFIKGDNYSLPKGTKSNPDGDRFYIGFLGEYALLEYFKSQNIEVDYTPRLDGLPDSCDFFIGGKKVNIKTGKSSRYCNMMIPEAQFQRHIDDVYVGALLGDALNTVELKGWITREEYETAPPKTNVGATELLVLTRIYPLYKLNTMESLIPYLTEIKQQKLF